METFVVAYSLVWLAVFLYVARLDVHQRRISQRLEELETRWEEPQANRQPRSRAA